MTVIDGHDHVLPSMWRARVRRLPVSFDVGSAALSTSVQTVVSTCLRVRGEHVVTTFRTEVDSAALPTSKDTGIGRRLFVKVTRKINGHNSRKTRSNISGQETHIAECG